MKVITAYPVIINGKLAANQFAANTMNFSSFDASGKPETKAEIQSFQNWLDVKYPTWLNGGKLNKGSGYGTFGPATTKAWNSYGTEFTKSRMALSGTLGQTFAPSTTSSQPATIPATDTSPAKQEKMKKLGYAWDKAKGLYVKVKETGLLDNFLSKLGLGSKQSGETIDTSTPYVDTTQPTGMSKNVKIALIAGGAIALIAIIVVATKKK